MKSEDKARLTCINPCNKSTAKYQYSFAKEHRFTHNKTNNHSGTTFYDPPSTLVRRGGTLSRAKRDCQKNISDDKPAPGQYNPRVISAQGKVVFAPGRDVALPLIRNAQIHPFSTTRLSAIQDRANMIPKLNTIRLRYQSQAKSKICIKQSALDPNTTLQLPCSRKTRFFRSRERKDA